MTESLQNAFTLAARLSDSEQDAIAAWLIAELESDNRWNALFSGSQDRLAGFAHEALAEHSRKETKDWESN